MRIGIGYEGDINDCATIGRTGLSGKTMRQSKQSSPSSDMQVSQTMLEQQSHFLVMWESKPQLLHFAIVFYEIFDAPKESTVATEQKKA
jgi:hypothetical protein